MRILMKAPALLARVLGVCGVAPAEQDSEGWYEVRPDALYWCRDEVGRETYCIWKTDGVTIMINRTRADIWARLLEIGATDAEAEKLSR